MPETAELIWRKEVIVAGDSRLTVERWLDGDGERIAGRVPDTLFWGRPHPEEIERDVGAALGCAVELTEFVHDVCARDIRMSFGRKPRCPGPGRKPSKSSSAITSAST